MTHEEFTGVTFNDLDPSELGFQGHRSFPFVAFSPLHRLPEERDNRHNPDMYSGTNFLYMR